MKRWIVIAGWMCAGVLLAPARNVVAQESGLRCDAGTGWVEYPRDNGKENPWGFRIQRAKKESPNFPVVIGQDQDKVGVTISVSIIADPGEINYEVPVDKRRCTRAGRYLPGREPCQGYDSGYWYWEYYQECEARRETVYRYIDPQSVKIWLIPTDDTKEFIGWAPTSKEKYPFRYLYPEDWEVVFLKPSGFESVDGGDLWSGTDVEKFLKDHPGYYALKADPREVDVPQSALSRVVSPVGGADRVLALYGTFQSWPGASQSTTGGPCQIANREKGKCAGPRLGMDPHRSGLLLGQYERVTDWSIRLENAPLDLPGIWMIGVSVRVHTAYYRDETVQENFNPEHLERRPPGKGYDQDAPDHMFTSYILMSTLCLREEPGGCGL